MIVRLPFGNAFAARRAVALFSSSAQVVIRSRSTVANPVANSPASLNTASPIGAINNPKKAASITATASALTGGARPLPHLSPPLQKCDGSYSLSYGFLCNPACGGAHPCSQAVLDNSAAPTTTAVALLFGSSTRHLPFLWPARALYQSLSRKESQKMIPVELIAKVRRLFFAEHWKIGTIASQLGLHPDTVRSAIESHRFNPEWTPSFRKTLTDPYLDFINQTLQQYPRLRASRIYEMIRARGYAGLLTQLRRNATSIGTMCDRLLHHADVVIIEGSSYRRRESEAEKASRRNTP
jgi:hypothetical protein